MTAEPLVFHLIPHTHWDREWYLTRAELMSRFVPVMEDLLAELERDPAARCVLDGQTVLLHDYLRTAPGEEARIAGLVSRGALEIGPWYVLSDLLVPSGSSLRRNLELGALDGARFGRRLDVLYSPDAFGHPGELPALAAEFGLRHAVVRRGLGRPGGRDRDTWRWETAGGASLLVHHLPAGGYDIAIDLCRADADLATTWPPLRAELAGRAAGRQVALFLGADHHAVPAVSGLARRLADVAPGDEFRVSGLAEYFDALEHSGAPAEPLRGELRRGDGHAWVLQGVHSARSRMKRRHGEVEHLLSRIAEPLAQLAHGRGGRDQEGLLSEAWRRLLECQFHDTIAGTTCDAVQHEQEIRLASVQATASAVATASIATLAEFDLELARDRPAERPGMLVEWNPCGRERTGIRTAELVFFRRDVLVGPPAGRTPRHRDGFRGAALSTADGGVLPIQSLGVRQGTHRTEAMTLYPDQDEVDRVWIAYRGPALGGGATASLTPRPGTYAVPDLQLKAESGALSNKYISVRVSRSGVLNLEDRRNGERFGELGEFTDEADAGDLYTFSAAGGRPIRGGRPVTQSLSAPGPLVGSIDTRWEMRSAGNGDIRVRQLVVLHADSPIVRIRLDIDNEATDHRLRARFPVPGADTVLTGTALGSMTRRLEMPETQHPAEFQAPAAPAHRFLAMTTGGAGLAVLAPGFFEYGWDEAREVSVTLLRSVGELSRGELPERPGHAAWPTPTPEAQEQGRHTIHLAVVPMLASEAGDVARLEEHWEDAFLPVQSWWLGAPA